MSDKVVLVKNPLSSLPHSLTVIEDHNIDLACLLLRTDTHDVTINCETGKIKKQRRFMFEPLSKRGTHMTLTDFRQCVEDGDIEDDDGSGVLATATEVSNIEVWPSTLYNTLQPSWATHVVWYGK